MEYLLINCVNGTILAGMLKNNYNIDATEVEIKPSSKSEISFIVQSSFIKTIVFQDGTIKEFDNEVRYDLFDDFVEKDIIIRVIGGMSYTGKIKHRDLNGYEITPFSENSITIRIPAKEIEEVFER